MGSLRERVYSWQDRRASLESGFGRLKSDECRPGQGIGSAACQSGALRGMLVFAVLVGGGAG